MNEDPRLNPTSSDGTGDLNGSTSLELPVLPLRNVVLFPSMIIPLVIAQDRSMVLIDKVMENGSKLALFTQKNAEKEDPTPGDLHTVGTIGTILKLLRFPDGSQRILVEGLERVQASSFEAGPDLIMAELILLPDENGGSVEAHAHTRNLRSLFRQYHNQSPNLPAELDLSLTSIEAPSRVVDFIASNMSIPFEELQTILSMTDVAARIEYVSQFLEKELKIMDLADGLQKKVQAALDKNQREYYLKEQLKTIRKELGEMEAGSEDIEEFRVKIKKCGMPLDIQKEAERELKRMSRIHPEAAEYTVSRTYIDWLVSMPWNKVSIQKTSFERVQKILDQDHFGLEKVKERILEYLAVRKLNPERKGPILCFLGPPGVGKTSLGKSIARAIGLKFQRVSLGGVRDESEIRGHRRTYIGAMPGRIIKAIRKAGTLNPMIMLDELDKLGHDFRGDPSSALLEVLDPEQNKEFHDHYLDAPFDLSQVMFIATANQMDTIPSALKDRLEIIDLTGYLEEEKLQIAKEHLIPKQVKEHGLTRRYLRFEDSAVTAIIRHYTSEAGVRNLERELAAICRKVAKRIAFEDRSKKTISKDNIEEWLGPQRIIQNVAERVDQPGIAVGLAWTPSGGEILFIEATRMPGKQGFKITGKLGEVMKESAEAALSYLRSNFDALKISADEFEKYDIHVHIPAGAVPKDGPSAGVTLLMALTSVLSGRLVRGDVAMTGEITLRGKILPVGGVKEKVLAARRAGISTVILPTQNAKDLLDVPKALQKGMTFHFVDKVSEMVDLVLLKSGDEPSMLLREAQALSA